MAREYFLTYHDNLSALKLLSDSERGRLYLALLEYSAKDENPQYKNPILNGNEKFLFEIIKTQIDREKEKYKKQCEVNKENAKFGKLGGRPKKTLKGFENPEYKEKEKEEYENKDEEKHKNKYEKKEKLQKKKFGEFKNVLLTEAEYERLKADYGDEINGVIEHLSVYIEMKGYKAKSHNLAIRNWVVTAYREKKQREIALENRVKGGANNGVKREFNEYPEYDTYGTDDPEKLAEEIRRIKEKCAAGSSRTQFAIEENK